MSSGNDATGSGAEAVASADARSAFVAAVRGDVILPDDDRYDGARRVRNGMVEGRPAVVARRSGTADVVATSRG